MVWNDTYYFEFQKSNWPLSSARHLLFKWKRSVFKIIWHEFALFVFAYALLSCLYRFLLIPHSKEAKQTFELICISAEKIMTQGRTLITFLTGFYVTQVVNRWWKQFMTLPWPDRLALKVANFIPGNVSILHYYLIYTLILIYATFYFKDFFSFIIKTNWNWNYNYILTFYV